jgi:group I intron endonuclease
MSGVIYQITCKTTGKIYIGQATDYKYKNEKPYNYGASGRWNDHVSSSKTRNTPLYKDIQKYGKDDFTIDVIENDLLQNLDEREAYWIEKLNTIYPSGYNVAKHARNRHRDTSNLHIFYKDKVSHTILSPIKKGDEYKLVYAYLRLKDGTEERIAFGQKAGVSYEEAFEEATQFVQQIKSTYEISGYTSTNLSERYASKLKEFQNKEITSVRITSASNLIAVYIGTSDMKLSKEHVRICFGGKTIAKEEAYNIAKEFVAELNISDKLIKDSIKSSQQVTA